MDGFPVDDGDVYSNFQISLPECKWGQPINDNADMVKDPSINDKVTPGYWGDAWVGIGFIPVLVELGNTRTNHQPMVKVLVILVMVTNQSPNNIRLYK